MSEEGYEMIGEGYAATGEVKGLCLKCKFLNTEDPVSNCYENNSYKEFAKRHKVIVIVAECKEFKDKEAVEEVKVIPGHEFENDVMKLVQEAEAQQEAEAKAAEEEIESIEQEK
jgi:glutamate synthase domain-containing protein 2